MIYHSQVAAAIGGLPVYVKQLVEQAKSALLPNSVGILNKFQFILIDKDFAVFAVYLNTICWNKNAQLIWKELCNLALKSQLSYVFYRVGEDYKDIETDSSYGKQASFEKRLSDLFIFSREILSIHPKLSGLEMD